MFLKNFENEKMANGIGDVGYANIYLFYLGITQCGVKDFVRKIKSLADRFSVETNRLGTRTGKCEIVHDTRFVQIIFTC